MLTRKSHPIFKSINNMLIDLPAPSNISYFWNLGSLLGICLMIQLISGIFLSLRYCSDTSLAFNSVNLMTRDVNFAWMIRIIHANGASLFFFLVYLHIGRGIYFYSFNFLMMWTSGIILLFLLMATAFLGYVLPWGQMSFWGATVITNLLTAIPYAGNSITTWLWGGFTINKATLMRFYSFHFILPFIMLVFVLIHLIFLHEKGSSNPLGNPFNIDKLKFHPFFTLKDIFGIFLMLLMFNFLIFSNPYLFFDADNFMPANPLVTPPHIQPEWYFLFAYAILRSIPNKVGGVMALFFSILILISLPLTTKNYFKMPNMYPINKILFYIFFMSFMFLTFLGACPIETPFIFLSQTMTIIYFLFFFLFPISTLYK
uniref:Cytochrome b n=1 Tax=Macrocheles nataliae TaxID=2058476 RepID=A0A6B9WH10_9ACAR|nr:cytochrome b [Macrocheles nataliae]